MQKRKERQGGDVWIEAASRSRNGCGFAELCVEIFLETSSDFYVGHVL